MSFMLNFKIKLIKKPRAFYYFEVGGSNNQHKVYDTNYVLISVKNSSKYFIVNLSIVENYKTLGYYVLSTPHEWKHCYNILKSIGIEDDNIFTFNEFDL